MQIIIIVFVYLLPLQGSIYICGINDPKHDASGQRQQLSKGAAEEDALDLQRGELLFCFHKAKKYLVLLLEKKSTFHLAGFSSLIVLS